MSAIFEASYSPDGDLNCFGEYTILGMKHIYEGRAAYRREFYLRNASKTMTITYEEFTEALIHKFYAEHRVIKL